METGGESLPEHIPYYRAVPKVSHISTSRTLTQWSGEEVQARSILQEK